MILPLVLMVVTATVRADPGCRPPRFEGKMVFSASAFHHVKARSEIHCYDWCWAINSCYSISFNNISRLCRLFSKSNHTKTRFQNSAFEMYAVKKNPLCKPLRDPCSSHQCPEGNICISDSNTGDGHACNPIRYQPLASCPQLEPSKNRILTYTGNTPQSTARVRCRGTTQYTGSNKTLTCSTAGTWEPDVGVCVLYLWTNMSGRWTGRIPPNTLVPGRCLEMHGSCPGNKWFTMNLASTTSPASVLFHLTNQNGVWVRNTMINSSWGWQEEDSLVEPFFHDQPINLTICFFEGNLKLFGQGRLFAEYQERMTSSAIDKIQFLDVNVTDKVLIRDIGNPMPRSRQTTSTTTGLNRGS